MSWTTLTQFVDTDIPTAAQLNAYKNNVGLVSHMAERTLTIPFASLITFGVTSSTTYYTWDNWQLYIKPADLLGPADNIYFEVCMYHQYAGMTAYVQLEFDGTPITGTELSTTGTTPTRLRSENLAVYFTGTTAGTYKIQTKSSSGSGACILTYVRFVINL